MICRSFHPQSTEPQPTGSPLPKRAARLARCSIASGVFLTLAIAPGIVRVTPAQTPAQPLTTPPPTTLHPAAQPVPDRSGPTPAVATVAQISIEDLQRQRGLVIQGTIVSVVGNEFVLDDGTGQVIVDTAPRWYRQYDFRAGERVTVVGEYDDYDFDAFEIRRETGEVLTIRSGPGRPPWAGGPRGRNGR